MSDIDNMIESLQEVFFADEQQKEYSSTDIMEMTGATRQTLRMAINNELIIPTYVEHGKKEYMVFTYKDVLTMYVVVSLMDLGIKIEDNRKDHPDTVTEIFKKADGNLVTVIKLSEEKINNRISQMFSRISALSMLLNFDFRRLGGDRTLELFQEAFQAGYNLSSINQWMPAQFEMPIKKIIDRIKEDTDFNANNYVGYMQEVIMQELGEGKSSDNAVYKSLYELLCLTNEKRIREKLERKTSTATVEMFIATIEKGIELEKANSETMLEFFEEMLDNTVSSMQPFLDNISEKMNCEEIENAAKAIIDIIDSKQSIDETGQETKNSSLLFYVQVYSQFLSAINLEGELARRIDNYGGEHTTEKIMEIAKKVFVNCFTPILTELSNLFDSDASEYEIIQKLIDYFTSLYLSAFDNYEESVAVADIILKAVEKEVITDSTAKDFWEYAKVKIYSTIKEKYGLAD
ncbi:hypothetical protein [Butyrivibrio fibrisolvens]|uniref:hypothetical protein n=1 Tax=Butyrivibrio fibrisolvens TaxID=831 RepID=UPI0003B5589F|nr:hypothetical protein [Butyrivibrio fibrisolvens]